MLGLPRTWFFCGSEDNKYLFENGYDIRREDSDYFKAELRELRRRAARLLRLERARMRITRLCRLKAVYGRTVKGMPSIWPDILACSTHDPLWQNCCHDWWRANAWLKQLKERYA